MIVDARTQVAHALEAAGVETEIIIFEDSTATSQEAADCLGVPVGAIAKSLCFMVVGEPILVIASGDTRIDDRKLGQEFGVSRKKVKIATADQVQAATGFAPGGVAPVGHTSQLTILVDQALGRFDTVYAAAGTPHAVFEIAFKELVRVTKARVVDLTQGL